MKAVILTRVSTKMQEERLSLRAQSKRLEEYAERRELDVIKRFEIIESSTRGERKRFMEMINFCKKQAIYQNYKFRLQCRLQPLFQFLFCHWCF